MLNRINVLEKKEENMKKNYLIMWKNNKFFKLSRISSKEYNYTDILRIMKQFFLCIMNDK